MLELIQFTCFIVPNSALTSHQLKNLDALIGDWLSEIKGARLLKGRTNIEEGKFPEPLIDYLSTSQDTSRSDVPGWVKDEMLEYSKESDKGIFLAVWGDDATPTGDAQAKFKRCIDSSLLEVVFFDGQELNYGEDD